MDDPPLGLLCALYQKLRSKTLCGETNYRNCWPTCIADWSSAIDLLYANPHQEDKAIGLSQASASRDVQSTHGKIV